MKFPIIAPTYHGYAKYCGPLLAMLGQTWPGHPPVWFITDDGHIPHCEVVRIDSGSWVERLYRGITAIRRKAPRFSYCFLLQEDLFPVRRVDPARIRAACVAASRYRLNCVTFVPLGRYPARQRINLSGATLYRVPEDECYYSQVKPGLWKVSHLMRTCEIAMRRGIGDPLSFEKVVTSGHYVSAYHWPSRPDGIFHMGWVDPRALEDIRALSCQPLAGMLAREYLRQQFGRGFAGRKARMDMGAMTWTVKAIAHPLRLRLLKALERGCLSAPEAGCILGTRPGILLSHLEALERARLLVRVEGIPGGRFCLNPDEENSSYHSLLRECSKIWLRGNTLVREDRRRAEAHMAGGAPGAKGIPQPVLGSNGPEGEVRDAARILALLADAANFRILRMLDHAPLPEQVVRETVAASRRPFNARVERLIRAGLVQRCICGAAPGIRLAGPHGRGSFVGMALWILRKWEHWNPVLERDMRKAAFLRAE